MFFLLFLYPTTLPLCGFTKGPNSLPYLQEAIFKHSFISIQYSMTTFNMDAFCILTKCLPNCKKETSIPLICVYLSHSTYMQSYVQGFYKIWEVQ
jgi:hypothetical protein